MQQTERVQHAAGGRGERVQHAAGEVGEWEGRLLSFANYPYLT